MLSPIEVLERCIGSPLWIIMQDQREVTGTLFSYDENLNVVLHNATFYEPRPESNEKTSKEGKVNFKHSFTNHIGFDNVPELVFNGKHVALFVPGGQAS